MKGDKVELFVKISSVLMRSKVIIIGVNYYFFWVIRKD